MEPRKNKKHALVAFIFGVLAALPVILLYLSVRLRGDLPAPWELPAFLWYYVFPGVPILSGLALVFGIIALRKKEKKSLSLIGIILGGLVILVIIVLIIYSNLTNRGVPGKDARVVTQMHQMTTFAELFYFQDASYERVRCSEESDIGPLCEDIEAQVGVKPIIHSTKDEYCIYVLLLSGEYYCRDSSGGRTETETNPSVSGYCNGVNFNCPPKP